MDFENNIPRKDGARDNDWAVSEKTIRLGVIGCGAVTKTLHLPVLLNSSQVKVVAAVDSVLQRARAIVDTYGLPLAVDDYRQIINTIDAAIVAVPHHLHAGVTMELLEQGVHVFVEKPMALKSSDCDKMVEKARGTGSVLAVGLVRRFFSSSQYVKQLLDAGLLGEIIGFDVCEGTVYEWNVESESTFRRHAGGGVLMDTGSHILDLLLWWLGDCVPIEYYDDALGGVEADCRLHLQLKGGGSGFVELSRTRNLRNTWRIHGTAGTLEVGTGINPAVRLKMKNHDLVFSGQVNDDSNTTQSVKKCFQWQLANFLEAIHKHRDPLITGQQGKRSVELIENCYRMRKQMDFPWVPIDSGFLKSSQDRLAC